MGTSLPPFRRLLVPYDGSDPARAALKIAVALAASGAQVTVLTIVDEKAVISQAASATTIAFDPTPVLDALDAQGAALLNDAVDQCQAAGFTPETQIIHETPVAGIIATSQKSAIDLVIMGTHARSGVARTFLGSTTEGVLRLSSVPVLTVRTADQIAPLLFASALVAVDDSEPADRALAVAAMLARVAGSHLVACHVIEMGRLYENALDYGFDAGKFAAEMREEGALMVQHALQRVSPPVDIPIAIVDGKPSLAIMEKAKAEHANLIIVGSHGRRGLRRLFLGSVAESIVRNSDIPVLVVPGSQLKQLLNNDRDLSSTHPMR